LTIKRSVSRWRVMRAYVLVRRITADWRSVVSAVDIGWMYALGLDLQEIHVVPWRYRHLFSFSWV